MDQRFREALGERVGVRPAELVRAPRARIGQGLAKPADAVLANLIFKRGALQILRGVPLVERLPANLLGHFGGFRARLGWSPSLMCTRLAPIR